MIKKLLSLSVFMVIAFVPLSVIAQSNSSLPIATTLEIADALSAGGQVVVYDEESNDYSISNMVRDAHVYGVTAESPALVFATASGTIPVVTSGAAKVQVSIQNGPIKRGDLLTSSDTFGVAMKANLSDDAVFAVALEDYANDERATSAGSIVAEVGVEQAQTLQESRRAIEKINAQMGSTSTTTENEKYPVSLVRASIAAVIAVGGLFFILFSFRSTIAKGVISVGRNPRARTSIITLAFGNIIFALVLCAVVVFIAIGVLVLPL